MIPLNMRLKVRGEKGGINLWIPLVVLWILLLPAAILAFVVWVILRVAGTVSSGAEGAARIVSGAGAVLWRLGGLKVDIRSSDSVVKVRFW